MTTEDDFQKKIDADPEDDNTRLVFADWLQDRGDPRADGYRTLGRLRRRPYQHFLRGWMYFITTSGSKCDWNSESPTDVLPRSWYAKGDPTVLDPECEGYEMPSPLFQVKTRREVEDAAALAWRRLPPRSKALILRKAGVS